MDVGRKEVWKQGGWKLEERKLEEGGRSMPSDFISEQREHEIERARDLYAFGVTFKYGALGRKEG